MKRMNIMLDEEALESARMLTGKKSYSETINHLVAQVVRQEKLMKAIDALAADPDPWFPGYVEEQAPDVAEYLRQQKRTRSPAANTAHAPKRKVARRGSR
jgi:predicted CopG family antitoxin